MRSLRSVAEDIQISQAGENNNMHSYIAIYMCMCIGEALLRLNPNCFGEKIVQMLDDEKSLNAQ